MSQNRSEFNELSVRAFSIIELIEVAGLSDISFTIVRKKLLDLGNDILRLGDRVLKGDDDNGK